MHNWSWVSWFIDLLYEFIKLLKKRKIFIQKYNRLCSNIGLKYSSNRMFSKNKKAAHLHLTLGRIYKLIFVPVCLEVSEVRKIQTFQIHFSTRLWKYIFDLQKFDRWQHYICSANRFWAKTCILLRYIYIIIVSKVNF